MDLIGESGRVDLTSKVDPIGDLGKILCGSDPHGIHDILFFWTNLCAGVRMVSRRNPRVMPRMFGSLFVRGGLGPSIGSEIVYVLESGWAGTD